ncbi:porin [Raoultella terrigena]|uniref:porin n=1 Tax=Raoultella terrigena TaxID=577 RepID=UPI001F528125|nr:porin [Raoultella terrigena]MCI1034835.1 porin [Raoultella terrigena]
MNKILYLVVPVFFTSLYSEAAIVYNKDGSKLDLYGKIAPRNYMSSQPSQDGDKTWVRVGFKAETSISSRLTAYARWEQEYKGNNPETTNAGDKTRFAFAGLRDIHLGSLDYGRNFGVLYDIGSWTDMLPEFGSDTWSQNDVFMAKRTTGVLTWRSTDFFNLVDGLNLALQYQGKNESGRDDIKKQNGDGWGTSLVYKTGNISTGLTYARSDRTLSQKNSVDPLNAKGEHAEALGSGIKYDDGKFYAAVTYSQTHNMTTFGKYISNKAENFESVIQYQFDNGIRPSLAYLESKGRDFENTKNNSLVKYVSIGSFYYLTKNVSMLVDYKINLLDDNDFTRKIGLNTDDVVAVGMTYAF